MSSFRWSGKRVKEFLEAISDEQTNFKTKPSGRLVKTATGTKVSPNGYFRIDGAYGGWQLVYVLPYSTGVTEVTSGFVGSGELADKLITMGRPGLRQRYRDLEKNWKPIGKRQFDQLPTIKIIGLPFHLFDPNRIKAECDRLVDWATRRCVHNNRLLPEGVSLHTFVSTVRYIKLTALLP